MPQISVIVPVYKVEKYINRCVDSILAQTFQNFELILVDDGSPDNCGAICDAYAKKDRRVVVIHQENGGLSAARNSGIDWVFANSDSQWITFIDSDDWVSNQYLVILIECALMNTTEVVVSRFIRTTNPIQEFDNDDIHYHLENVEEFYCRERANATVAWGKLYPKRYFEQVRYPKGRIHEDEYITYKLLFQNKMVGIIECPLYYYYVNENSITGQEWNPKRMDVLEAYEQQIQFFYENAYSLAEEKTTQIYLKDFSFAVKMLQKIGVTEYKSYKRKLRVVLKKYLHISKLSDKEKKAICEVAYPYYTKAIKIIQKKWNHLLELIT